MCEQTIKDLSAKLTADQCTADAAHVAFDAAHDAFDVALANETLQKATTDAHDAMDAAHDIFDEANTTVCQDICALAAAVGA
jgi:hypothetical protein